MGDENPRKNAETAREFLRLAGERNRPREAFDRFVAPDFVHHNPYFEGTRSALLAAMETAGTEHPNEALELKRLVAEGDLVATFSRVRPKGGADIAVSHWFRFKEGRIVELWDVIQPVPEDSPNRRGMF